MKFYRYQLYALYQAAGIHVEMYNYMYEINNTVCIMHTQYEYIHT